MAGQSNTINKNVIVKRRMVSSVALCEGGLYTTDNKLSTTVPMFYIYILESISYPTEHYIGHTSDLRRRLKEHNTGKCSHTSKYIPWKIKLYIAFETIDLARQFEKYLKSGSGHALAKKHFFG